MESASVSLKNLIKNIKLKFSSLTLSSRSLPSIKGANQDYCILNKTFSDINSHIFFQVETKPNLEMNPRILDRNISLNQKEPDQQSPKIPSMTRESYKSFEQIKSFRILSNLEIKALQLLESEPRKVDLLIKPNFKKNLKLIISDENPKSPLVKGSKKCAFEKPKKKTLFEVLSNFYLAKKFINTLKNITSNRTPKFLTKNLFNVINDLAFFFDIWKQNEKEKEDDLIKNNGEKFKRQKTKLFEQIQKKSRQFVESFEVFDNSSTFMIFWNVIHLLFILYFFISIPLEACFNVKFSEESTYLYYIQYLGAYFFVGDILVNCNTAAYLKGKLIKDRFRIIKNYMKSYMFKDFISIVSIFLQINATNDFAENFFVMNLFRFLFFLKMINFSAIIKKLEEMVIIDQSVHNILSLIKLIFRIILLSHIFACLWYYIGTLSPNDSWIAHYDLVLEPWWIRYLSSYYFVCVTMNTVGYGDITPQNSIEKVFTIVFIYIACGIFAYSLNSIGVIVSEIARRENEFQKDLNVINEFMKQKKINFDLRMRVRKYLEYIWYEEKIEKIEEQTRIFEKLSDSLKEELLLEANGAILRDLKLFSLNFSEDLLRNTVPLLKEVRFTPEDLIFMKGKSDQKALYIIRKGKVEIFLETNKTNSDLTVLKTLQRGEIFGELSFFSNQERTACARSMDFTTAYMIRNEDFINLLKKFPKDYQKFCEIKDNINIYGDFNDLYIRCYSCHEVSHLIQDCPNINYKPIKDILLHRYFISLDQVRSPLSHPRKIKRFNAILKQALIEKKSFDMQATLFPLHESEETSNNISEYSQKALSKSWIENSSFDEKIIKEDDNDNDNELSSGEILKEKKKEDHTNKTGGKDKDIVNNVNNDFSPPQTFKDSSKNDDELIKPEEQKRLMQRKNTKSKYFISENKDLKKPKTFTTILENIESEVYNALLMESSSSFNSLSQKSKNEFDSTHSLKNIKNGNIAGTKLRSLLNYITDLKECRESKKKEEMNINITNTALIATNEKDNSLLLIDMIKSWDVYFPHNNSDKILEVFNFLNYNQRIRANKHHSSKSSLPDRVKANQCMTSRRQTILEKSYQNVDKNSYNQRVNANSLIKKNFFQSNNVMEKFIKEIQFDPEKIKKHYKRLYEKNKIRNFLKGIVKKLFGWWKKSEKKNEIKMKKRISKENKQKP